MRVGLVLSVALLVASACVGSPSAEPDGRASPTVVPTEIPTAKASPTESALMQQLRRLELPSKPTGMLSSIERGPARDPATAPLYLADSELGEVYDESVRLARQRDPAAQLIEVDVTVSFAQSRELRWLTLVYYSPLDKDSFAYEKMTARTWPPTTTVPMPTYFVDQPLRVKDSVLMSSDANKVTEPGVLPWTRWRTARMGDALFVLWTSAGRPANYMVEGHMRATDPYDAIWYLEDHLPPNANTLGRILTASGSYYLCLGGSTAGLDLVGRFCTTTTP